MASSQWTWEKARIAVTGARGGLGQAFCSILRAHGAEVHGISRGMAWDPGAYECVILNAGFSLVQSAQELPHEAAAEMFEVNLWQTIVQAQTALARGVWHVHVVGSTSGILPSATFGLYAATKYGLRGWAYAAARELPGRVSISYPTGTKTNFLTNMAGPGAILEATRNQIQQAYASYDEPDDVVTNILAGIQWGAREIIPSIAALQWCLSIEHDMRRMWFPGLQQASAAPWDWWDAVQHHYQSCPWMVS